VRARLVEALEQLQAVLVRQVEVQQDQVGLRGRDKVEGFGSSVRQGENGEAGTFCT